jgi:DNA-binding MarR family transcriptional regulator
MDDTVGFLLRLAQLRAYELFHAQPLLRGTTPTRWSVLAMIADNPGIRPHEIAATLRVKRPNLAALQAELEAAGLVARLPGGPGVRLRLTEAGTARFATLAAGERALDAALTAALAPAERAELVRLLHKLTQA